MNLPILSIAVRRIATIASLFALLWLAPLSAQPTPASLPTPTADYPLRSPQVDTAQLHQWQANSDFDYNEKKMKLNTHLWERLLAWISEKIGKVFQPFAPVTNSKTFWDVIGYGIVAIALGLVVSKLVGADLSRLFFRRSKKNKIAYDAVEEDINAIDFGAELNQAIAQHDYRKSVRLYYLQTLKVLADRQHINWQRYKTNRHYWHELRNTNLQQPFNQLTRLFDYIWYGEFQIDDQHFRQAQQAFQTFEQTITRKATPSKV